MQPFLIIVDFVCNSLEKTDNLEKIYIYINY